MIQHRAFLSFYLLSCSLLAGVVLSGCGPLRFGDPGEAPPAQEIVLAVDGVKLIERDILRGDDLRSFQQRRYSLHANARLLIRYEMLMEENLGLRQDLPVRLRLFAESAEDLQVARAKLRACPITRNWMMAATWNAAHPWRGGEWTPGAEIDWEECIPVETTEQPTTQLCSETQALCFNISRWYRLWVRERKENFGLALVSEERVNLLGDASPGKAPRIHWHESAARAW